MKWTARILLAVTLAVSIVGAFVCRPPALPELPDGRKSEPGDGPVGDGLPEARFLRSFAKELIARDVIAGRRPPLEAAALFRELDRLPPRLDEMMPPPTGAFRFLNLPELTEEERFCHQVIAQVGGAVAEEPQDRAAAVLARVEAALWAARGEGGAIRLPDPATLEPMAELLTRTRAALTAAQRQALPGTAVGLPNRGDPEPASR
jgi:hypothetical protein